MKKNRSAKRQKKLIFEQYKLYVASMEKVSDRRLTTNNYFMTVNTAILTMIGLAFNFKFTFINASLRFISILGITLSIIWISIVFSYKQLNTGKFLLIHDMERYLPIKLYKKEWENLGKGKDLKKYIPFSHIELLIPLLFIILYFGLLSISFFTLTNNDKTSDGSEDFSKKIIVTKDQIQPTKILNDKKNN